MKTLALLIIAALAVLTVVAAVGAWDSRWCPDARYAPRASVPAALNRETGGYTDGRIDDVARAGSPGCGHWYRWFIPGHHARCQWNGGYNVGTYSYCGRW